MVRKKVEETPIAPTHQRVRVNKQETYTELRPVETLEETEVTEEEIWDPFASFSDIVTDTQAATIHIWQLPNFEIDGRTSPNGTERVYCGSVPYRDGDDTLLSQIHQRVPLGGTVSLELKVGGAFKSSGLLKITRPNGQPAAQPGQTNPSFIINQPQPQQVQTAASSMEMVTQQFEMVDKVVSLAQRLIPPAPVINTTASSEPRQADERPIGDRILEAVTLKALENKDTPIDRILDALGGGRKEPSWIESLMPVIVELAKAAGPAIGMGIQAYVRNQAMAAQQIQQPAAEGSTNGVGSTPAALPPSPPMDPAERAWRITVRRLLEDCFEHVTISAVSPDGMSVIPASTNIVDLLDRFQNNEQLVAMVNMLLNSEPAEVVDLCAILQTDQQSFDQVTALKEAPPALVWLKELQMETKKALAEGSEEGNENV